ncbi:MAG: L,D-transpeptidase [Nitrospirota bacterium]|nr:L,D-transpeptidase [Nitrospirota bacterium]MDP2382768.1 L,D-transpeptidase [Nitrospirota bacterium]MDP3597143.1 L,D-transpeptidase [Nitrospirota bacterium]
MKRVLLSLWSVVMSLFLVTLVQSSGLPQSDAVTIQLTAFDHAGSQALQARYKTLVKQLTQLMPTQPYILVDTARNHLYIKRGDQVLLDALASTGSGTILDKPGDSKGQWIFDTPRGEFTVQSKLTNPVWVKPDWAFIEEGLEVPKSQADRLESGVLGEYALGFGKGYFIHGTLYTRLLGKNVTHGCIRLNDDDLRSVYRLAKVGTPILIF